MHPKGANSMAASGLGCRKALVGIGLAISFLLCQNQRRNNLLACGASICDANTFILVCMGSHWPRDVTIENTLTSGYGLSHESAENGCKSSWVKF